MVTLAESLQEARQARTQLGRASSSIRRREQEIRQAQAGVSAAESRFRNILPFGATLTQQFSVSQQFGLGGVAESIRRSRQFKRTGLRQVGQAKKQISVARKELEGAKSEVGRFESQLQSQERLLQDIGTARAFISADRFPFGESKRVREFFFKEFAGRKELEKASKAIKELREQGLEPIFMEGRLVGFESEQAKQSFELGALPTTQPSAIPELERLGFIRLEERITRQEERLPTAEEVRRATSIVSLPRQDIFTRARGFARERGGTIGVQLAIPPLSVIEFGAGIATRPVETVAGVGRGLVEVGRRFRTGEGFPEIGRFAAQDPLGFTARVTSEILTFRGLGRGIGLGVRGVELGRTIISPRFRPVTTRELTRFGTTERFIGGIPEVGEIGLIPPRLERVAPTIRPTVRGGFGFTRAEQAAFIGERGPIVTAQRDFRAFDVPLEQTLFATPPLREIGFVRVSRLGLEAQREATLSDILAGDITFRRPRPQIIAFPEEVVGRRGGFQPFGLPSTELEVTLERGVIRRTGQPAVTIIGGRRVPVITAEIVPQPDLVVTGLVSPRFARTIQPPAIRGIGDVRLISSTLETRPFISPTRFISSLVISTTRQISPSVSLSARSLGVSAPPTPRRVGRISPRIGPTARGLSLRPSPPLRIDRGLTGFGFTGLPSISIRDGGFGFTPLRRTAERRRVDRKKVRRRRRPQFPISVSFTAQVLDLRGRFPTPRTTGLGLTPEQLRVIPRRRRRRN